MHGYGKYIQKDGTSYEGYFKKGLKHGTGKWIKYVETFDQLMNKNVVIVCEYEGDFKNDKKEGHGIFKWGDLCFYEGQFLNDYRHGYGKC